MDFVLVLLKPLECLCVVWIRKFERAQEFDRDDDPVSDDLNPALRNEVVERRSTSLNPLLVCSFGVRASASQDEVSGL